MYRNILIDQEGKTAVLTINREKNLNALNRETLSEIEQSIGIIRDDKGLRGLIITGAGEKAFVAGADIKEFMDYSAEEGRALSEWGQGVMDQLYDFPKPVVAAINGFALGGGLELALACHLRVASSNAKLGLPEVSLGIIPGYGGTQRLSQLVGRGKALEMIMTGEMIDAEDALKWGLVNYVCTPEELIGKAKQLLDTIYLRSEHAVALAIEAVNSGYDEEKNGQRVEMELFGKCFGTEDFKEGVNAFLSKRKPNF